MGIVNLPGAPDIPERIPGCNCPIEEVRTILLRIAQRHHKIMGEEMLSLLTQAHDDMPVVLRLLNDTSIDLTRRRSLWMMAAHLDPIKWLTVPKEFLPRFEIDRREKERTMAYAFFQAYKTSGEIIHSYGRIGDTPRCYAELPNLLYSCRMLHDLGVQLQEVGMNRSHFQNFLHIAQETARDIQYGIRNMIIQRTPDLDKLLDPFKIKLVK